MAALLWVRPSARRYAEKKLWRRSSCCDQPALRRCRAIRTPLPLPAWSSAAMVHALTLRHMPARRIRTVRRQCESCNACACDHMKYTGTTQTATMITAPSCARKTKTAPRRATGADSEIRQCPHGSRGGAREVDGNERPNQRHHPGHRAVSTVCNTIWALKPRHRGTRRSRKSVRIPCRPRWLGSTGPHSTALASHNTLQHRPGRVGRALVPPYAPFSPAACKPSI